MKHLYVVTTYVRASSVVEALKLAKKTTPQEVNLHGEVWKSKGFALEEDEVKEVGFK